ncbi:hypothetical protein OG930_06920 [Streptomyces sp. NBC_01799]|nr:hypothetical protein OG930_06920 [Streptomyces sp. NBC_01799]
MLGEVGNFGGIYRRETEVFRRAGVLNDLELVEALAAALHGEYAAARWDSRAREVLGQRAYAQVTAGTVDRFASTAALLGSEDWRPLDAVVVWRTAAR